jgi:hypothetical protein
MMQRLQHIGGDTVDYRGVEVLTWGMAPVGGGQEEQVEFFPEATEFRYLDNGQRLEVLVEGKPVASFNGQLVHAVHYAGVTEASRQRVEIRARVEAERAAGPTPSAETAPQFTEAMRTEMWGPSRGTGETGPTAPRSSQADPAGAAMPAGDEGRDVHATEPELRAQQLTQEGTPPADVGPLGGVPDAVKDAERAEKADAKAAARAKAGADKE